MLNMLFTAGLAHLGMLGLAVWDLVNGKPVAPWRVTLPLVGLFVFVFGVVFIRELAKQDRRSNRRMDYRD